MDENGAVKFPADKIEQVLANARGLLDKEATQIAALRKAKTAAEVKAASSGGTYTEKKS